MRHGATDRPAPIAWPGIGAALATLVLGAWPATAHAQGESAAAGRNVVAGGVTLGKAVEINGSVPVDPNAFWVRWSRPLRGRFLGGEPAYGFELHAPLTVGEEPRAWGAGLHVTFEQRWKPAAPLHPLLQLGAGMVFTDRPVPPGATTYDFSLFAGLGLEARFGPRGVLQIGYRFHHMSNADTGPINPGINAHELLVGVGWRF